MTRLRDLVPGTELGSYELVLRLAAGGMGEVWCARLKRGHGFQKLVALKTLLPHLSGIVNFEKMFLDEAALAAKIVHPNVVAVTDLGEEDEILFQVMEWVSGETLWSLMRAAARRGGVPLPVAARILYQVAAGLHAAHELRGDDGESMGLVHRDVSPQNVLITITGVAKVVDFGVAKFAGRGAVETKAGELRGKVPYMAPEHIRGEEIDRRADVFALGLLLYQLVSGKHPFLGDDDLCTISRLTSLDPAAPLASFVPGIPKALDAVVARALAKSPEDRTPTARALMHDLAEAVPECALIGSDQDVAAYLSEVSGGHAEDRAREIEDALRMLDERFVEDEEPRPRPSRRRPITGERPSLPTFSAASRRTQPPIATPLIDATPTSVSSTRPSKDGDRVTSPARSRSQRFLWIGAALLAAAGASIVVGAIARRGPHAIESPPHSAEAAPAIGVAASAASPVPSVEAEAEVPASGSAAVISSASSISSVSAPRVVSSARAPSAAPAVSAPSVDAGVAPALAPPAPVASSKAKATSREFQPEGL